MIPRISLCYYTTSAADDEELAGPEYVGRMLIVTWLVWTFEIAVTREVKQ